MLFFGVFGIKSQTTQKNSENTPPNQLGGGADLQFTTDAYDKLAVSQCRLEMLRILKKCFELTTFFKKRLKGYCSETWKNIRII